VLEAIRHDPDPARLDRFLGDLPSDNMKKQLMEWKGIDRQIVELAR
jgi:hypothetical protein